MVVLFFISLQVGLDPEKMLSLEEWRDRFRQKEPENESPRVRKLYVERLTEIANVILC